MMDNGEIDFSVKGQTGYTMQLVWRTDAPVSGFIVEKKEENAWKRLVWIGDSDMTSCEVFHLQPSTEYHFRIQSFTKDEDYEENHLVAYGSYVECRGKTTPAAVKRLKCIGKSENAILLKWGKSLTASGYIIEQFVDNQWKRIARIADKDVTQRMVKKLKPKVEYKFRICAFGFYGKKPLYSLYREGTGKTMTEVSKQKRG